METFIESIHFLEIIYLRVKNNIPKKLECVPCSLLPNECPGKVKLLVENQEMQPLLLLVCLKVKFMLQDLPEQVPMPLPRLKKKKAC